jgi:DNA (cytosine-5)-methyltransferase 1
VTSRGRKRGAPAIPVAGASPSRPRLLDLFCGGFGAGEGYRRAGFDVTGVDFVTRQDHPAGVTFLRADVRDVLTDTAFLRSFDLVAASPPCKVHTRLGHLRDAQGGTAVHGDLLDTTRQALLQAGVPYILENVEGAPMRPDVMLCGTMFGLHVYDSAGARRWLRRHRLFELGGWGNYGVGLQPPDVHPRRGRPLGVYGSLADEVPAGGQTAESLDQARALMGAPWMSWAAITQAIPPAYTEYLGGHALAELTLDERKPTHDDT